MSLFLLKSILSLILIFLAGIAMFTMFEIFGRTARRFDTTKMKKLHKISGIVYVILFFVVGYLCLDNLSLTKSELSARSAFHGVFAQTILILLGVKLLYTRVYLQFYEYVKIIGLLMALITFVLVGTSAGYYLLISDFGTDTSVDKILQYKKSLAMAKHDKEELKQKFVIESDPESVGRGKNLFDSKCKFCHHANSTETLVGPGLKGILKKSNLPASNRPATPENIILQFRDPFNRMPSFEYLSDEEVSDIIAYLNSL